jgi:hypothetical protein
MSLEGLIVTLVIASLGIGWIIYPFLMRDDGIAKDKQSLLRRQHKQLKQRYAQVVATIQGLDEDHSTHKILGEEYSRERQHWAQNGVQVLKELDRMEKDHPALVSTPEPTSTTDDTIDDAIEDAVARYLNE